MKNVSILKSYLPNFSALHPMTFSIISSIYWLFCDDGEQQPKVSHFPSERSRVGAAEVSESQDRRKVWRSGGGGTNCNLVGITCPHLAWNKVNWFVQIGGGGHDPPCPFSALTALEAGCMSQAITNAAKAEVGLDRRIMQSYPLIYQSSASVNESNAQISRSTQPKYKTNTIMLMFQVYNDAFSRSFNKIRDSRNKYLLPTYISSSNEGLY